VKKKIRFWQWLSPTDGIAVGLIGLTGWLVGKANYQAGKYLLGWDSVWSEINIGLSFRRALAGLWQEFQGVGLQGGHGYVSDLFHTIWVGLIACLVPLMQVRYVSIILLFVIGGWGVYFLIKKLTNRWFALVASFVYMFHPFILQQFFVPHDAFIWFFAFLPGSILAIINALESWNYGALIGVILTQVLLTFAGFIPPQMLAYLVVVGVLFSCYVIRVKNGWRNVVGLGLTIFVVHSFWFLPFLRFGLSGSNTYLESKLNTITTPENDLKSEAYGGWGELITGMSYYFESLDVVNEQILESAPILSEWASYWDGWVVKWVLITIFVIGGLGWLTIFWERKWLRIGLGLGLVLTISGLASRSWPLSYLGRVFHFIPVIDQAFRIGLTKFSIIYVLFLGIFVAFGLEQLVKLSKKWVGVMLGGVVIGGILLVSWPAFQGKMFYERMRVEVPQEYLSLIEYLGEQEKTSRVAELPVQTYNGWQITKWGYTGSGFLFYGIEQPMLDQAFNVWSRYSEGFYQEFSTAIYGADKEEVERVLDKYDVRYVLLDESVIAPGQGEELLRIPETKTMAAELGWEEKFHEDFLTLWQVPAENNSEQFVSAPESYLEVGVEAAKARRDIIFDEQGMYIVGTGQVSYPFASLMKEEVIGVEYEKEGVKVSAETNGSRLEIPGFRSGEVVEMGYQLIFQDGMLIIQWTPVYDVNGEEGPKLPSSEMNIGTSDSVWMNLGGRSVFVKNGESIKGMARLEVGEPITFTVYDGKGVEEVVKLEGEQECGEENQFRCWAISLDIPKQNSLLQTITHFEGGTSPEVCLDLEGEPYECTNQVKTGATPIVVTQNVQAGQHYWLDYVDRTKGGVALKVPGVVWYTKIGEETMPAEVWSEFEQNQQFELDKAQVVVEVKGEPVVFDFARQGKSEAKNCDLLSRGTASKSGDSYQADQWGAVCDFVTMSEIETQSSYLMRVKGENQAGRSVKFFLYNTGSARNDLEFLLDSHIFDQTFSLLPWGFQGSYNLNIETRSFGQLAQNKLEPVEVRYFPLEQLARAKVLTGTQEVQVVVNGVEILKVSKTGTWLYRVRVKGEGLIKLSQGYDQGWLAWSEGKLLGHKTLDGWSNGWISNNEGEQSITIFYWPQLLEYVGFGLLGIAIWQVAKKREH